MSLFFPEHVIKHGPWSISKANTAAKCTLEFDYKYGPKPIYIDDDTAESRLGVAVHYALELALDDVSVSKAMVMSADKYELTTDEVEQLEAFREQIERFTKKMRLLQQKHDVHPANRFMERKWGLTKDFQPCNFYESGKGLCIACGHELKAHKENDRGYKTLCPEGGRKYRGVDGSVFFRGVVDFGMLTARKDLIIIDHKSGKEREIDYYAPQFRAYCLMALANIPGLRGVQTAINYVMTDSLKWDKYVTADTIRQEYQPWLVEFLTKSCTGLLQEPTPTKSRLCDWCIYKKMKICPAFGGTGRVREENR